RLCRGQFDREAERGAAFGAAVEADLRTHALNDARGDRKPKPGAVVSARKRAVALLEFVEDPRLRLGVDAGAGIADDKSHAVAVAFDNERNAARSRELHRIAGE